MKFHQDHTLSKDPNVIFVFGSNLAGRHGAGAALVAVKHYSAVWGAGCGLQGRSYAIPTKNEWLEVMTESAIRRHVEAFLEFAKAHDSIDFFVTRVGCGLAGFQDATIAPMFKGAGDNCDFAQEWERYLK